jgi:hypothetical protein
MPSESNVKSLKVKAKGAISQDPGGAESTLTPGFGTGPGPGEPVTMAHLKSIMASLAPPPLPPSLLDSQDAVGFAIAMLGTKAKAKLKLKPAFPVLFLAPAALPYPVCGTCGERVYTWGTCERGERTSCGCV